MKNQIRIMFNSIYEEYDLINNFITFGLHKNWKKQIVDISKSLNPKRVLDVATGTADIAIALTKIKNCEIIGMDLSSNMLEIGQKKIKELHLHKNVKLELGDVENLEYNDNYFDVVTVGYGVRNFENLKKGKWAILVGPEGGFSEIERNYLKGLKFTISISLGPRILRADTAAVAAISLWQNYLGDW